MSDSTPDSSKKNITTSKRRCKKATETLKKVINVKENFHASADALFFVRLFARACQPV